MKKIEKLKQELALLEALHKTAWDMYGSELCAAEMMRKERVLRDKISKLESKPVGKV